MKAHLRANLWLLVSDRGHRLGDLSRHLLGLGQSLFREKAQGSLIVDSQGNPLGSRLIAQPFSDAKYFQPRPSAVSYNAAATGGTQLGPEQSRALQTRDGATRHGAEIS